MPAKSSIVDSALCPTCNIPGRPTVTCTVSQMHIGWDKCIMHMFCLIDCSVELFTPRFCSLSARGETVKSGLVCSSQGTFPIRGSSDVTLPEFRVLASPTEDFLRSIPCELNSLWQRPAPFCPLYQTRDINQELHGLENILLRYFVYSLYADIRPEHVLWIVTLSLMCRHSLSPPRLFLTLPELQTQFGSSKWRDR